MSLKTGLEKGNWSDRILGIARILEVERGDLPEGVFLYVKLLDFQIRFGAAAYRRCKPSSSSRKIEHDIPSVWPSMRWVTLVRTSFRGAPRRINFNASSTASLDRVCAGAGDVGDA